MKKKMKNSRIKKEEFFFKLFSSRNSEIEDAVPLGIAARHGEKLTMCASHTLVCEMKKKKIERGE